MLLTFRRGEEYVQFRLLFQFSLLLAHKQVIIDRMSTQVIIDRMPNLPDGASNNGNFTTR